MFDYLIVGAGFAGCVLAETLAAVGGKKGLIIDKRNHIGVNVYDFYDKAGILIISTSRIYSIPIVLLHLIIFPSLQRGEITSTRW
ncbi:NAD(P)-binding protein [Mucilaginibacter sp.]|uniref:NAD(P)-binding protein n=1 Tax=Mucilaginibacter sp. TaxID=1882438 RepID=UPI003D151942